MGRGPGRTAQLVPARGSGGRCQPSPASPPPLPGNARATRYRTPARASATPLDPSFGRLPSSWESATPPGPGQRQKQRRAKGEQGAGTRPRRALYPPSAGSGRPRRSLTVAGAARLRHQSPDSPQVRAVGRGPCATSQRQSPSPRLTCAAQAHATQPGPVAGPPWALPALDFLGRRGGPAALSLSCGRGAPGPAAAGGSAPPLPAHPLPGSPAGPGAR